MALNDLPRSVGLLIERIVEDAHTFSDPYPLNNASELRFARMLAREGLVVIADDESTCYPTKEADRWLDMVGVAPDRHSREREQTIDSLLDAPSFALPDDLVAQVRALCAEIPGTEFATVHAAVVRLGLATIAERREPAKTTVSTDTDSTVRVVGGLIVWADVCRIAGAPNPTQFARSLGVNLLPLSATIPPVGRGRPPTTGIEARELFKLEGRYGLAAAQVRSALGATTTEAAPAPAVAFYALRCVPTGRVLFGRTRSPSSRRAVLFSQLRKGTHTQAQLQADWQTHGADAFVWASVPDGDEAAIRESILQGGATFYADETATTSTSTDASTSATFVIRHKPTGAVYVGASANCQRHWYQMRHALKTGKHHCKQLQDLWTRDGADAFEFEIGEHLPRGLLTAKRSHLRQSTLSRGIRVINV